MLHRPHPIKKIAKWLGISLGSATLVLLLMLGGLLGGLFWLAAQHSRQQPLDLMPYLPRIQAFLAQRGLNVELGGLELYYDNAPVLRAEGLQVFGPDGELAIFGEAAAIKLAKGRLFTLQISPKIIEARGVTLRLVRTPSGVVTIAGFPVGGSGNAPATTASANTGVVEWLENLPGDSLWGRLKQIRVQGLTLLLRDQVQNAEWVLEDGKLAIDRYEDSGERGSLLGQIRRLTGPHLNVPKGVRGLPIPVLVGLERVQGAQTVQVEAKFGQLNAAIIGDYLPPQLQDLLTGRGTLSLGSTLTRGNLLGQPWLTLRLRDATLNLPKGVGFADGLKLPQLEATVSYQPLPSDTLYIRNLSFTGPRGNLFVISGSVLHLATSPTLNLSGFSPGGEVQALFDFFPSENLKLQKTYRWLRENLIAPRYRNLTAQLGLHLDRFPGCAEHCGPMRIDAEVLPGGKVRYMDDLPLAEITSSTRPATFHWRGQQLAVIAPNARVANQQARSVWVNVNNIFSPSPTLVQVSATLAGGLAEVIERLNAIPEINGQIPGRYTGVHQSVLNIHVPLVRHVSPSFLSSTVLVQSVVMSPTVFGLPIVGSSTLAAPAAWVTLSANKTLRVVAPKAELLGGRVGLVWQQNLQPKQPSAMQLQASGTVAGAWLQQMVGAHTISASGGILASLETREEAKGTWAFRGTAEAKGAMFNLGPVNYRKAAGVPLTVVAQGRYTMAPRTLALGQLRAQGEGVNVSGSLSLPLATPERGRVNLPTLQLGATDTALTLQDGTLRLRGKTLDLRGLNLNSEDRRTLANLTLDAQLNQILFGQGRLSNATLQAAVVQGRWQLQRVGGEVQNGGRMSILRQGNRLNINVPNLGRTLEVFGVYDKLKDGTLFGTLTYSTPTRASGELKLNNFELRNPPTMMKILGLLSLEQLVAGTDTTKFATGKIPLSLDNDAFTFSNAHFSGPSMDLRLDGQYLRATEQLDFNGSLAPAIPFNRLVSKVPLLGTLLTGSQDGLVVADFRLKGPTSAPEVSVRPLSILTPGLLKDLFRGGTTGQPNRSQR
jgi:hypothetical protein